MENIKKVIIKTESGYHLAIFLFLTETKTFVYSLEKNENGSFVGRIEVHNQNVYDYETNKDCFGLCFDYTIIYCVVAGSGQYEEYEENNIYIGLNEQKAFSFNETNVNFNSEWQRMIIIQIWIEGSYVMDKHIYG